MTAHRGKFRWRCASCPAHGVRNTHDEAYKVLMAHHDQRHPAPLRSPTIRAELRHADRFPESVDDRWRQDTLEAERRPRP